MSPQVFCSRAGLSSLLLTECYFLCPAGCPAAAAAGRGWLGWLAAALSTLLCPSFLSRVPTREETRGCAAHSELLIMSSLQAFMHF